MWFFCFNMKFSISTECTRKKSKFPPWGRTKREGWRIPLALINSMGILSPSLFPLPHGGNSDFFLVNSIHILNFILKPKKRQFSMFFHWGHNVPLCLLYCVKSYSNCEVHASQPKHGYFLCSLILMRCSMSAHNLQLSCLNTYHMISKLPWWKVQRAQKLDGWWANLALHLSLI